MGGPLKAAEGAITYHVIEAVNPADAILEFARQNNVDHIIMGARAASTMRSLLGSVSGAVAANAPCTVTVVRVRGNPAAEAQQSETAAEREVSLRPALPPDP